MTQERLCVGIDLGTTNSCIALCENGKVSILENQVGERSTPSIVCLMEDQILYGKVAKTGYSSSIENTFSDIKRIIGRKYSDIEVEFVKEHCCYNIKCLEGDKIGIVPTSRGSPVLLPQQVTALFLNNLFESIKLSRSTEDFNIVITVPVHFSDVQRVATREAAYIAGENVTIIDEPTAAAICYAVHKKEINDISHSSYTLVFDFGGGTLDVSIVVFDSKKISVISSSGDPRIGGEDIDILLSDYLAKKFESKYQVNPLNDKKARLRIQMAAIDAKIQLSASVMAIVSIPNLYKDYDLDETVTRTEFEKLMVDVLERISAPLDDVLSAAHLTKDDIDDIILTGGSSNIVCVREFVEKYFGKKVFNGISSSEAVATGAAYYAQYLQDSSVLGISDIEIVSTLPRNISIGLSNGISWPMITRNKVLPQSVHFPFRTISPDQSVIKVNVYDGNDVLNINNKRIATFTIKDIPPLTDNTYIRETIEISKDREVYLSAQLVSDDRTIEPLDLQIESDYCILDQDELDKLREATSGLLASETSSKARFLAELDKAKKQYKNDRVHSIINNYLELIGEDSIPDFVIMTKYEEFQKELEAVFM